MNQMSIYGTYEKQVLLGDPQDANDGDERRARGWMQHERLSAHM